MNRILEGTQCKNEQGFTLFEIIVVLAIGMIAVLAALSLSINRMQAAQTESLLNDMESAVFLYQQHAFAHYNDVGHGIYFGTDSYTLFTGEEYSEAVTEEEVTFPADVSVVSVTLSDSSREIVFEPGTFRPSAYGSILLSDGVNGFSFDVNREGLLEVVEN